MIFLFPVWWNMDSFPERENISDLLVLLGISSAQGKYSPGIKRFIFSTCHMCTQQAPTTDIKQSTNAKTRAVKEMINNLVVAICWTYFPIILVDAFGRESLKFYPESQNFFALDVVGREPLSTLVDFLNFNNSLGGQCGWHLGFDHQPRYSMRWDRLIMDV